jgi:hypothetical protein
VDQLDGHNTFHQPVLGLEDLAHAALAERLEQAVVAQDQLVGAAGQEAAGLVIRQPSARDQPGGQVLRLPGRSGLADQRLRLLRVEQLALP